MSSPTHRGLHSLPLSLLGSDLEVPLVTGEHARYVNFDYAASPPCLRSVADAVTAALPWYGSVHRGAGFASSVSSDLYRAARSTIARFVGARANDRVVFTRNSTDALNLLSHVLPSDTTVVTFASEHHANLLPWRRGQHVHLPVPRRRDELLEAASTALAAACSRHKLLAIAGASNVTGELLPIAELAEIARRHDARIALDAAQLVAHRAIDIASLGVDYLVASGHKLYAPFGAGILVGRADWLDAASPYLAGGGSARVVTVDSVEWAEGDQRHEGGTPNFVGAIAMSAACQALSRAGMNAVAAHEERLRRRIVRELSAIPYVELLSIWEPDGDRVGIVAFTVRGWHPSGLAAALSAEHGIGVRDGAFCAHPLLAILAPDQPGAVRVSFGVGTSDDDVDRLLDAVRLLVRRGAAWRYRAIGGRVVPDPDPRPKPVLHDDLPRVDAVAEPSLGGGCAGASALRV